MLHHMPRFQPEVFDENIKLVNAVEGIAQKKGVTPAALCLAWVASLGPKVIPIPGSSYVHIHNRFNLSLTSMLS